MTREPGGIRRSDRGGRLVPHHGGHRVARCSPSRWPGSPGWSGASGTSPGARPRSGPPPCPSPGSPSWSACRCSRSTFRDVRPARPGQPGLGRPGRRRRDGRADAVLSGTLRGSDDRRRPGHRCHLGGHPGGRRPGGRRATARGPAGRRGLRARGHRSGQPGPAPARSSRSWSTPALVGWSVLSGAGFALFFVFTARASDAAAGQAGLWPIGASQLCGLLVGGVLLLSPSGPGAGRGPDRCAGPCWPVRST